MTWEWVNPSRECIIYLRVNKKLEKVRITPELTLFLNVISQVKSECDISGTGIPGMLNMYNMKRTTRGRMHQSSRGSKILEKRV